MVSIEHISDLIIKLVVEIYIYPTLLNCTVSFCICYVCDLICKLYVPFLELIHSWSTDHLIFIYAASGHLWSIVYLWGKLLWIFTMNWRVWLQVMHHSIMRIQSNLSLFCTSFYLCGKHLYIIWLDGIFGYDFPTFHTWRVSLTDINKLIWWNSISSWMVNLLMQWQQLCTI